MKETIQSVMAFETEIANNNLLEKVKFEYADIPADASLISIQKELQRIEPSVLDFYEAANGFEIKWQAVDKEIRKHEMTGSIKVNPFLQVVKDWNGVVFFDQEPADSPVRKFFPLDFFADEAAVGFCTKEGWRNMLYLYQFDGELVPLYVSFESYLQLMLKAKGCFYWQYLILELIKREENEVSQRIKKYLPSLFTNFSFSEFEKLFTQLRIK